MSVPEQVLRPEYWDNHSFEDFCRGDTVNYLPHSAEEKARLRQRELDKKVGLLIIRGLFLTIRFPKEE